jgi:quercetin dioxygenase-like cupin family protein
VFLVGDTYTTRLTGPQTGGAFTMLEAVVMPDAGPPPHRHHHEEETFVLLEGAMTFTVDGVDHLATPGSVILVPRNVVHSYRTAGDTPARMLFLYSPPGMEGMFPELGRLGVRGAVPRPLNPADLSSRWRRWRASTTSPSLSRSRRRSAHEPRRSGGSAPRSRRGAG